MSTEAPTSETTAQPKAENPVPPERSLRIIESASFVAVVTAAFYFMGFSYYRGYFERISLPPPFPELSTTDYFLRAFSSLTGLIVAVLVTLPYRSTVPTTIWQALWVNSAFIVMPLVLGLSARASGFLNPTLAVILGGVALVTVIASLFKLSAMKLMTMRWGLAGALAYAFALFSFFGGYFRLEGAADATALIEGRLEPSTMIVLQTKDPESPVNGEPLLVALARGGYYLVRQESPAPDVPVVYFVPESEVVTATIQRARPGS
jgi:hypothetical protein